MDGKNVWRNPKSRENFSKRNTQNQDLSWTVIKGTCLDMCPANERQLREREGLLHKFEIATSENPTQSIKIANNTGPTGNRNRQYRRRELPKADASKTIKSFARSAAGQNKVIPTDLRPPEVLCKTVKYLMSEILTRKDVPFNVRYDFIFDRLRAVRQDLVIQRIENLSTVKILETIVNFHLYSDFMLRHEDISVYDPHINHKHLVDCLRKLLKLYEILNLNGESRDLYEGLNCLVHIDSYSVLSSALNLRKEGNIVSNSIKMALAFQCGNFLAFFRTFDKLPCVAQMYCTRHARDLRFLAFKILSAAYGVKTCKIPLSILAKQLAYTDVHGVQADLKTVQVEILTDENNTQVKYAKFCKTDTKDYSEKRNRLNDHVMSQKLDEILLDTSRRSISEILCSV